MLVFVGCRKHQRKSTIEPTSKITLSDLIVGPPLKYKGAFGTIYIVTVTNDANGNPQYSLQTQPPNAPFGKKIVVDPNTIVDLLNAAGATPIH